MECWIGIVQEEHRRVVHLAGRLGEAQVPELIMACFQPDPVLLDLSDLVSTDKAGLDALLRVQAGGATLVSVPGYVHLQLEALSRMREAGQK